MCISMPPFHSLLVLQANTTISALREQVAHLEYAIEQHGALMEEVRREEWAAAERRAAEVIVEYKRDLQRSLDEERTQMETDTHSLKMEIEVKAFAKFSFLRMVRKWIYGFGGECRVQFN
jgi:outer membrane protein assembly factor BamD (BamD/ComL family)